MPSTEDDMEAMIRATSSTLTPGKGVRKPLPIPQEFGPRIEAEAAAERSRQERINTDRMFNDPPLNLFGFPRRNLGNDLANLGDALIRSAEWVARHAVSITIAWAMIAFGIYWAVSTAYLIGANR